MSKRIIKTRRSEERTINIKDKTGSKRQETIYVMVRDDQEFQAIQFFIRIKKCFHFFVHSSMGGRFLIRRPTLL